MNFRAENFYAGWRESCHALMGLRETGGAPPEKLLQAVWLHQRLRRDRLATVEGRALRVLHPGFASREGGPDFRGAVLQFDAQPPVAGDVEIDREPAGWRDHGHDRNPAFQNVILHVVWVGATPAGKAAMLALQPFLDAPVAELALALEAASGPPENWRGQCAAPLREWDAARLTGLLHAAAQVRFQNKAQAMLARAREGGWEPALWENLFRALGYKHNVWPLQNLAETQSRWRAGAKSAFEIQARLLGVSGLLPGELTRSQKNSDTFLRRAWDLWWRERDRLADCVLPRSVWKFHGLRPANHPQRRLALAAHWLAAGDLIRRLEDWIARPAEADLPESLLRCLQPPPDEFWSWHWTFTSARLPKPQPLLGAARATDLAVNVILPWLWLRAVQDGTQGGNDALRREVERRFLAWPAAEDNAVLKLARQRLLGGAGARVLSGAAQQQGLMQIVRDFCEHSNAVCADCRFPGLVRDWTGD